MVPLKRAAIRPPAASLRRTQTKNKLRSHEIAILDSDLITAAAAVASTMARPTRQTRIIEIKFGRARLEDGECETWPGSKVAPGGSDLLGPQVILRQSAPAARD